MTEIVRIIVEVIRSVEFMRVENERSRLQGIDGEDGNSSILGDTVVNT